MYDLYDTYNQAKGGLLDAAPCNGTDEFGNPCKKDTNSTNKTIPVNSYDKRAYISFIHFNQVNSIG